MSLEENKAVALGYLEAFAAGDLAAMDRFIAPGFVRHDPGLPFQVRGPDGVKQLVAALHAAFPGLALTTEDVVAEGDRVLVRLTVRVTHRGEFMGLPPTGKAAEFWVMDLFRVAGGTLAEQWALLDNLTLLRHLGAVPGPEAAGGA